MIVVNGPHTNRNLKIKEKNTLNDYIFAYKDQTAIL
jgi:hypothetical protein